MSQGNFIVIILCIIIFATLTSGCGTKPPQKKPEYKPSTKIPPTQRPYTIFGKTYYPLSSAEGFVEEGYASWYGPGFHGKRTASGEIYNMYDITAAHKILPMNTMVKVTNLENGRELVCRINDRGPFVKDRIIDLSYASAQRLGIIQKGIAYVRIEALAEGYKAPDDTIKFTQIPNIYKGHFFIQVGAFTLMDNAINLRDRLVMRFNDVRIDIHERDGIMFYRVQIFAGNDYYDALNLLKQIEREFPDAFVVAR